MQIAGAVKSKTLKSLLRIESNQLCAERVAVRCKLRESLFDFTSHLFDVDVQSVAIDRTMGLEVEDRRERVATNRLLVDRAFNLVHGILDCLFPKIRELRIF